MLILENMSRTEKLRLMESLWQDLSRDEAATVSPAWHGAALAETERLLAAGEVHFIDWEEAKKSLREGSA